MEQLYRLVAPVLLPGDQNHVLVANALAVSTNWSLAPQLRQCGGVKIAMCASKSAENVMRGSRVQSRFLGLSIVLGATIWVGGTMAIVGSYLHERVTGDELRFCEGRCICDGGTLDSALMQRVCPEGWEQALARAVSKRRRERRLKRIEQARRGRELEEPPHPSAMVPSV